MLLNGKLWGYFKGPAVGLYDCTACSFYLKSSLSTRKQTPKKSIIPPLNNYSSHISQDSRPPCPSLPGVGHVRLPSLTFLQPEFGENPHQYHDGHHSTDNIHDHVGLIAVGFLLDLRHGRGRPPSVSPHGRVVVGAGILVQAVAFELAAESVETGAAAEQVDAGVAVERRVPLAHDVVVTPATVAGGWKRLVFIRCRRCQCSLGNDGGFRCLIIGRNLRHSLARRPGVESAQRGQPQENGQQEVYQVRLQGGSHLESFCPCFRMAQS